jgi:hypothetical protein
MNFTAGRVIVNIGVGLLDDVVPLTSWSEEVTGRDAVAASVPSALRVTVDVAVTGTPTGTARN